MNKNPDSTRIADYISAKIKFEHTPARITNGECFRLVNDEWVPEQKFIESNPVSVRPKISQLENADRKAAALK